MPSLEATDATPRLPLEIIQKIVTFLQLPDVCNCMLVCREWKVGICFFVLHYCDYFHQHWFLSVLGPHSKTKGTVTEVSLEAGNRQILSATPLVIAAYYFDKLHLFSPFSREACPPDPRKEKSPYGCFLATASYFIKPAAYYKTY